MYLVIKRVTSIAENIPKIKVKAKYYKRGTSNPKINKYVQGYRLPKIEQLKQVVIPVKELTIFSLLDAVCILANIDKTGQQININGLSYYFTSDLEKLEYLPLPKIGQSIKYIHLDKILYFDHFNNKGIFKGVVKKYRYNKYFVKDMKVKLENSLKSLQTAKNNRATFISTLDELVNL